MFLCFQCFLCPIREALKKYIVLSWHKVQIDAFLWMLHFVTAPWLLVKGVSLSIVALFDLKPAAAWEAPSVITFSLRAWVRPGSHDSVAWVSLRGLGVHVRHSLNEFKPSSLPKGSCKFVNSFVNTSSNDFQGGSYMKWREFHWLFKDCRCVTLLFWW